MHRNRRTLVLFLSFIFLIAGALWLTSCGSDKTTEPKLTVGTCNDCHQDALMLQATMDPDEEPGEGGDPGEG